MRKILYSIALSFTLIYAQPADKKALVSVTKIKKEQVNSVDTFTGSVGFVQTAQLASQTSGKVKKVLFEVGQSVQKGEKLVVVDSDILEAQLESAKADFENARLDYQRYKALRQKDAVAQKVYDQSRFAYLKTKAALKQLEIQKRHKNITAPFNAIVTNKNIDVGEWVNPGSVVANLNAVEKLELFFNVPKEYASSLKVGTKYEVSIGKKSYFIPLQSMIPSGDKLTRTFPVKFTLSVKDFVYAGMEAVAKLPKKAKATHLIVPRDSVINRFGGNVIFVVVEGRAKLRPIEVVGYAGLNVAIQAEGIEEGMLVVTKGNERIFPDQPVKMINMQDR